MSWIALMPFPAFNPLNWWALTTPANAMRAGLHNTHVALDAWRAGVDGWRAMVREQQDALFSLMETESEQAHEPAAAPQGEETARQNGEAETDSAAAAAVFVAPMLEVTRAYGRMGKAFIVAQRDTMRAIAEAGKPH